MSLLNDGYKSNSGNKRIFVAGGVALVVLILIIVALLAIVTTLNKNKISLTVNSKRYSTSSYLINKDDTTYIAIEDLTKIMNDSYTYKSGNKDAEDDRNCYVTNGRESTFFEVDSKEVYKILEETNEIEFYTLDKPVIKENGKMYMPIDAVQLGLNINYSNANNKYNLNSIGYLESYYNQDESKTFVPDESVVWETEHYSNMKMLKYGLVVVQDQNDRLGVSKISASTDKKTKVTTVSTTPLITTKYTDIKYVEKYNQLVVQTENGQGIVQLDVKDVNYNAKTLILPQYEILMPMGNDLYIVGETQKAEDRSATKDVIKYGIVNKDGDVILPTVYDKIGIDATKFLNNDLKNQYIIFDSLIPVTKDGLCGFVNLNGQTVIELQYSDFGCTETNSNSNVFIIPEENAIVMKSGENYSIISKTGKSIVGNVLIRVYKEIEDGKEEYLMLTTEKKFNVLNAIKDLKKQYTNEAIQFDNNEENSELSQEVAEEEEPVENEQLKKTNVESESENNLQNNQENTIESNNNNNNATENNNSLNNNQSEQEEVITINTQSNENKTNENNAQQANVKTEEEIRQELENKTKQAIEE